MSESEVQETGLRRQGKGPSSFDPGVMADDTPVEVQTRDDFAHSLMEQGVSEEQAWAEAAEAGTKGFTKEKPARDVSLKTRNRPQAVEGNVTQPGNVTESEEDSHVSFEDFGDDVVSAEQGIQPEPQEQPYSHRQTLETVHRDLSQKHTQSLQKGEAQFRQWAQQSGWTPQQIQQTWHQLVGPTLREMQQAYAQAHIAQAGDLYGLIKEHERDLREQGWKSKDEYERSMRRYGASREGRVTQSGNYINGNGVQQTTKLYNDMTYEERSKLTNEERDAAVQRQLAHSARNRRR